MFDFKLTLVSSDPGTLEELHAYLTQSGARLATASRLRDAARAALGADAVVLFADDYPHADVVEKLDALSATVVVIVTSRTAEFETLRRTSANHRHVVVLPRPTWGWMLLDAVRAGVAGARTEGKTP